MTLTILTFVYDWMPFLLGAVFALALGLFFAATSDVVQRRWDEREVVAGAEDLLRAEAARGEGAGR